MNSSSIRKGITTARLNHKNSNMMFFELAAFALGVGLYTMSWWWGGGCFLGLLVALFIKPIAILLMIVLSAFWGFVGYGVGSLFDSTGAMVVLAIIFSLCGIGVHFSALKWTDDLAG